jgi:hypothetical protein
LNNLELFQRPVNLIADLLPWSLAPPQHLRVAA